jgi:hypothetical protein
MKVEYGRGREDVRLPALELMWAEAPVSRYQSLALGGMVATPAELSAVYRALVSHGEVLEVEESDGVIG